MKTGTAYAVMLLTIGIVGGALLGTYDDVEITNNDPTALSAVTAAQEPDIVITMTEGQCMDFMDDYYSNVSAGRSHTREAIEQWDDCTDRYQSVLDYGLSLLNAQLETLRDITT